MYSVTMPNRDEQTPGMTGDHGLSPELSEVLHMLKVIQDRTAAIAAKLERT